MRDYPGIPFASLPDPHAPDFSPRLRNMFAALDLFLRDASQGLARIEQGQTPSGGGTNVFGNVSTAVPDPSLATVQGSGDLTDIQQWKNAAGTQVARMNYFGALDLPVLNLIDAAGAAQISFSGSGDIAANGTISAPAIIATTRFGYPDLATYSALGWEDQFSWQDLAGVANGNVSFIGCITGTTFQFPTSGAGALVAKDSTDLLSNKSLAAGCVMRANPANAMFVGSASITRTASLDLTSISLASLRAIKLNDVSGSMVLVGNTTSASAVLGSTVLTGQVGSLGAQTLLTGNTTSAGAYRLSFYIKTTTAVAASTMTVTASWNDGAAQTLVIPFESATVIFNNHDLATNNAYSQGTVVVRAAASQNITYITTVTSAGSPAYSLDARIEVLG